MGKAVGFEVYWGGSAAQILSDKPYTGEKPQTQDYSQQANPAIFQGDFNRGVYNTIREALLTGQTTSFGSSVKGRGNRLVRGQLDYLQGGLSRSGRGAESGHGQVLGATK